MNQDVLLEIWTPDDKGQAGIDNPDESIYLKDIIGARDVGKNYPDSFYFTISEEQGDGTYLIVESWQRDWDTWIPLHAYTRK